MTKVSTPEKEKQTFPSEHRADSTSVVTSSSTENEKVPSSAESSAQQRNEEVGEDAERVSLLNLDSGQKRGISRKQHWKSQSVGDTVQQTANTLQTANALSQEEELQEQPTFSANRELWQRRATSQTQLNPTTAPPNHKIFRTSQEFREMRQKHTPDLVMDRSAFVGAGC